MDDNGSTLSLANMMPCRTTPTQRLCVCVRACVCERERGGRVLAGSLQGLEERQAVFSKCISPRGCLLVDDG